MTSATLNAAVEMQHISYSQISMFDKCELSWYLKYVKGIAKPATIPMILGKAYHSALALNFRQKIHTAEDLPAEEVITEFTSSLIESISAECIQVPENKSIEDYTEPVERLLTHYIDTYAPGMQPLLVEQPLEKNIVGCNRKIVGILDLLTQEGILVDFKLSGKRFSQSDESAARQIDTYILLLEQMLTGELHVALKNNKKPAVQIVQFERTRDDILKFKEHLKDVCLAMEALEAGNKAPSTCTGFCSDKMCSYWTECQEYKASKLMESSYAY